MKKWIVLAIVAILLVIVGVLIAHQRNAKPDELTVSVIKGNIVESAEAVGYIKPRHFNIVKSQVDGIVEEIYHYEGEYVAAGTPLVKIKPTPNPADYASAHQAVDAAKVKEDAAHIDVVRLERELKNHLISKDYNDYTNALAAYATAKTQRILAEQKLALLDVGRTQVAGKPIANIVTSPVEGYILNRNINVGDPVLSISSYQTSTLLFSVADMKDLMFEGLVDEMDAVKIKEKMPTTIRVGTLPDELITGAVNKVSLQSEKENVSQGGQSSNISAPFNVGFKTQVTDLKIPVGVVLRSGYSATASIKIGMVKDVLLLPMRVIQFKGDEQYVLLPPVGTAKPKQQPVKLGISDGVNIEIKGGLHLGDKVLDKVETPVVDD